MDALLLEYGPGGLFLDRVIVSKVIAGHVCRFNSDEQPYVLERFGPGHSDSVRLGDDPAGDVGRLFSLDERLLRQALRVVGVGSPGSDAGVDGPQSHTKEE